MVNGPASAWLTAALLALVKDRGFCPTASVVGCYATKGIV
jgi:hypothetical protein